MEKEKKFYSLLQDLFIGAKLEGDSGYVNLMNIKTDYFNKIKEKLEREVKNKFDNGSPEDLYEKLYTFFDSYFSDSGAIFFSSTPDYKNIYTKVYNPREDVSLFWKTSKLYYVKSEANYRTIKNLQLPNESEVAFDFHFDASLLKHKKANEKKELEFYFTGIKIKEEKKVIKFQVFYKNDNDIEKLKEITKINKKEEVIKYILENSKKLRSKITLKAKYLDLEKLDEKGRKNYTKADLLVIENQGFEDELTVYIAITKIDEIEKYLRFKGVALTEVDIEKAFKVYKKQSEIDYFIHKDAKGFLREQFDLYVYEHLLGQKNLLSVFNQEALDREKKIKEIAYLVIDYIGNFEDELKKIWLKPKFVRKSNYVVTLDRMISKKNGFKIIQEILNHKGIEGQIKEWKELSIVDKDFKTEFIVKDNKINKSWEKLPIDTKYFKDLELEIIGLFENLDEELDGRLIKSENFQALNTLKPKYKGEIQTIYIDPPFNTGDDFQYTANITIDHCASDDDDTGVNGIDIDDDPDQSGDDWAALVADASGGDFTPTDGDSLLVGNATPLHSTEGIWRDCKGTERDETNPDIGAIEYVTDNIKSVSGITWANVKSIGGVAKADIKKVGDLDTTS